MSGNQHGRRYSTLTSILTWMLMVSIMMTGIVPTTAKAASGLSVTTLSAKSVDESSAVLRGKVNDDGGADIAYVHFWFREKGGSDDWVGYEEGHVDSGSIITCEVTNLEPNTTYEFEFQAGSTSASIGAGYGGIKTFTTDCEHDYSEKVVDEDVFWDDYDLHYFDQEIEYTCEYCGDSYTEWVEDEDGEEHDWNSASECTVCDCVVPEIVIENFSVSSEYQIGETLAFKGVLDGNGGIIKKVTINIQGPDSRGNGGQHYTRAVNDDEFNLTNVSDLTAGSGLIAETGTYWLCIWTQNIAGNTNMYEYEFEVVDSCKHERKEYEITDYDYESIDGDKENHYYWEYYEEICLDCGEVVDRDWFEKKTEAHQFNDDSVCKKCGYEIVVQKISLSANVTEIDVNNGVMFTAESNAESATIYIQDDASGTVAVTAEMTKNATGFIYAHGKFTNAGTKTVWAVTDDGTKSNEVVITVKAVVETLPTPVYTGVTEIAVGETGTISWSAVENATGYTCHVYDPSSNRIDLTDSIVGTQVAYTFTQVGSYGVQIYATATGYNTSAAGVGHILVACEHKNCTRVHDDSGNRTEKICSITETHHTSDVPFIRTCNDCGWVEEIYISLTLEHLYNDGVCICGATSAECNHDEYTTVFVLLDGPDNTYKSNNDGATHWYHGSAEERCGNCAEFLKIVELIRSHWPCTFVNGVCFWCGGTETACTHSDLKWVNLGDYCQQQCTHCDETIDEPSEHSYWCDEWPSCRQCGADVSGVAPELLVRVHNINNCTYEYIDDEKHQVTCSVCGTDYIKEHELDNGTCKKCGVEIRCTHSSLKWVNLGDYCQQQCKSCNEMIGEPSIHEYWCNQWPICMKCGADISGLSADMLEDWHDRNTATYEYIDVEKHRATCGLCGVYLDEAHVIENGACIYCVAPGPECEHTYSQAVYAYDASVSDKIAANNLIIPETKLISSDETTHTFAHPYYHECTKCGYAEIIMIDGADEHTYTDGVCVCGAEEPECEHEYGVPVYAYEVQDKVEANGLTIPETKLVSKDENGHTYKHPYYHECTKCDAAEIIMIEATEAHSYEDGVCVCGADEPECPHTNIDKVKDENAEPIYSDIQEETHKVAYGYIGICQECKETAETGYFEPVTEDHDFSKGEVCVCGAGKPACKHTNVLPTLDQNGQMIFPEDKITDTHHDVENPYKMVCQDCGFETGETGHFPAKTEEHTFANGNVCVCGYDRVASCVHEYAVNMEKPVKNTGVYTYNTVMHTRVSCDYEQYCTICGTQGPNLTVAEEIDNWHWYTDDSYEYDEDGHWYKYLTCRGCGYVRERGYSDHTSNDTNNYVTVEYQPDINTHTVITTTYCKCACGYSAVINIQAEISGHVDNDGDGNCDLCSGQTEYPPTVYDDDVVAKLQEFINHCATVSLWADKTQERSLYESVTLDLFTKGTGALTDGIKRIAGYQGIIEDEEMLQIVESMVLAEMDEVEYLTNTAFASLAELAKDTSDVADLCKKFAIDPLSDNWLTELGEAIATHEGDAHTLDALVEKVIKIRKAHDVYATGTEALGGVASFVQWLNDMQDAKRTYEMRSYMQAEAKEHLDALAAGFSDPHMVEVIRDYQKKVENALANLVIEQTISTLEGGDDIYGSYCKVIECLKDAGVFKHLPKDVSAYAKAEKAFKEFKIGKFKVEDIMDGMEIFDTIATVEGLLGNGKGLVESLDILEREHMALEKEVDAIVKELNTYYTYDAVTGTYTFNLTKKQITLRLNALGALCMATLNSLEDTTNILHKMYTEEAIGKLTKLIDRDGYEQAIKDIPEILKEIAEYKETTQALLIELQTMIETYPSFPE